MTGAGGTSRWGRQPGDISPPRGLLRDVNADDATMNAKVRATLRADPTMRRLVERYGRVTVAPASDPFRRLIRSIVSQQVSTASAEAIRGRLFEEFRITPAGIEAADPDALRAVGLSRQKVEYVKAVAAAHRDGRIDRDRFAEMDNAAVAEALTDVRGVGPWTAKMYLLFCLGREDVFPVEDLGIRNAMQELYGTEMDRSAMMEHAEQWAPYRSYASRYLWQTQD